MKDYETSKSGQRRQLLLHLLATEGKLTISEMSVRMDCSVATVRRDLELLEEAGAIIRTLGGAQLSGAAGGGEIPFREKTDVRLAAKYSIARKAATLVDEGDIVGLTGGTTAYLIAMALKPMRRITIVTNAVNIAMALADCDGIQVVLTGGVMRPSSMELSGPLAENAMAQLHIQKMFVGIDGLTIAQGITTHSELEARMAGLMIERSQEAYAVFDHTKAGKVSLFSMAPLSALTGVITEQPLPGVFETDILRHGLRLYITGET